MKWLVVGAGAIGGYFGGRLAQAGRDVTFLVHAKRQGQLQSAGLSIESPHGPAHVAHPSTLLAEQLSAPYDVVLVSCKAYDLPSAMDAFAPAVGPRTAILPLLNGLSHVGALQQRFGADHVLGGMCVISVALDGNGTVRHLNQAHRLVYGELDGKRSDRASAIQSDFSGAAFDAQLSANVQQEMWEKWVLIATVAGATCLMRAAICDIVKAGSKDFITGLFEECSAVAAVNGFAPRPAARERLLAFSTNPESTLTASMMKDMEHGARIEGEHIIGELIRHAGADTAKLRLLPIVHTHLRAYEARRSRENT
jgi:2-dehydropantoate 2-reductase